VAIEVSCPKACVAGEDNTSPTSIYYPTGWSGVKENSWGRRTRVVNFDRVLQSGSFIRILTCSNGPCTADINCGLGVAKAGTPEVIVTSEEISFEALNVINGPSAAFANFHVGDHVVVDGSTGNDNDYYITGVNVGSITVSPSVVDEVAGNSITLTQIHNTYPDAPKLIKFLVNGQNIKSYLSDVLAQAFENDPSPPVDACVYVGCQVRSFRDTLGACCDYTTDGFDSLEQIPWGSEILVGPLGERSWSL